MKQVVDIVVKTFSRKLRGQLEAVYLYGSYGQKHYQPGESDINLLLIVADGTSFYALRNAFLPLWQEYGTILRRAPLVAQASAFTRHLLLNPMLAHHLAREAQQLLGPPDFMSELAAVNPHEAYARLASEAMQASAALAPELLEPEIAEARLAQLRRLARRFRGEPIPEGETPAQLFARVQHFLEPRIAKLPAVRPWTDTQPSTTTSPFLPGLQAIYKEGDHMALVFARLTPQQIIKTNWQLLSERLANQCSGVWITTAAQLGLTLAFETPLAFRFRRYEHNWGLDPLETVPVSKRQMLRHAARGPSDILIDSLPNAYLTWGKEEMYRLIHDFQNKLLNVQLEHELLYRIKEVERFTPPSPLPARTAPSQQRIEAIFQHLDWWTQYYAGEMMKFD